MTMKRFDALAHALARGTSRRQVLKWLGATFAGALAGTVGLDRTVPSVEAVGPYQLQVSLSATCSSPVALAGRTVSGSIYVFTTPNTADIMQVHFWLDNPSMSGSPRRTEGNAPYDFAGGTVSTASPFDTRKVADGTHTVTAAIDLATGTSEIVSATFTVQNS
jgi:hypothetical protein